MLGNYELPPRSSVMMSNSPRAPKKKFAKFRGMLGWGLWKALRRAVNTHPFVGLRRRLVEHIQQEEVLACWVPPILTRR